MTPLRIAYLLEDSSIAGGTRVVLAQADALIDRGHEVALVSKGAPPAWRDIRARWIQVDDLASFDATGYDFVVGTFWTTLPATLAVAGERGVHFCQGYEGSFTAYQPIREQIEAAYRLPLARLTYYPYLADIIRPFGEDIACVGQIVDDEFFQPLNFRESGTLRVFLPGPAQADFKGIDVGYVAAGRARALGGKFDLVRTSQWDPADDEPLDTVAEFHVGLDTPAMVRLIASCDIVLGPSRRQEGFGLPPVEAMAGGLAAALAAIPSFLSLDEKHDYALFSPEGDGMAMGDSLHRLLTEPTLRRSIAVRGREVAENFRSHHTADKLERWFAARKRRLGASVAHGEPQRRA